MGVYQNMEGIRSGGSIADFCRELVFLIQGYNIRNPFILLTAMKTRLKYILVFACMAAVSCNLDRFPETSISENNYWNPNTVADFEYAANGIVAILPANWLDGRGDDLFRNKFPNDISSGTRKLGLEPAI